MNLDPSALLGEEAASLCAARVVVQGSAQEQSAGVLGSWIDETSGLALGFGVECLTERMQIMGLEPSGTNVSFGGATKILRCTDGMVALPLARDSDIQMLPAMFEQEVGAEVLDDVDKRWLFVEGRVAQASVSQLRERATLLGMPLAVLGEIPTPTEVEPALRFAPFGPIATKPIEDLRVLELAPMWAGPLAGKILAAAGAQVTKVESPSRPDGTREGSPAFFEYLNEAKTIVPVDFASRSAADQLRDLISVSDIVIEGSRPRALEQLGINAREILINGQVDVWLSVTGYGRDSNRVAFGDDAAVAGGLCDPHKPAFTGDASGDPLTGLAGALGILTALQIKKRFLIDLSMARVCAWAANRA